MEKLTNRCVVALKSQDHSSPLFFVSQERSRIRHVVEEIRGCGLSALPAFSATPEVTRPATRENTPRYSGPPGSLTPSRLVHLPSVSAGFNYSPINYHAAFLHLERTSRVLLACTLMQHRAARCSASPLTFILISPHRVHHLVLNTLGSGHFISFWFR